MAGLARDGVAQDARPLPAVPQLNEASAAIAPPRLVLNTSALRAARVDGAPQPAQRRKASDSVRNGAIIGAVAGAAALGGFAAIVCKVTQEPGGPSCVGDTLRIAGLGAAIGAGAGIAVDVALDRQRGVRAAVRFSMTRRPSSWRD